MATHEEIAAALEKIYRFFISIGYAKEIDMRWAPHSSLDLDIKLLPEHWPLMINPSGFLRKSRDQLTTCSSHRMPLLLIGQTKERSKQGVTQRSPSSMRA